MRPLTKTIKQLSAAERVVHLSYDQNRAYECLMASLDAYVEAEDSYENKNGRDAAGNGDGSHTSATTQRLVDLDTLCQLVDSAFNALELVTYVSQYYLADTKTSVATAEQAWSVSHSDPVSLVYALSTIKNYASSLLIQWDPQLEQQRQQQKSLQLQNNLKVQVTYDDESDTNAVAAAIPTTNTAVTTAAETNNEVFTTPRHHEPCFFVTLDGISKVTNYQVGISMDEDTPVNVGDDGDYILTKTALNDPSVLVIVDYDDNASKVATTVCYPNQHFLDLTHLRPTYHHPC